MRTKVLLSSLSVGRCFTLPVKPGGSTEESGSEVVRSDSILQAKDAWKITDEGEAGYEAVNAAGQPKTFAAETEVVEIQRMGYDKLAGHIADR